MPEFDDSKWFGTWKVTKNKQWWKRAKIIKETKKYKILKKTIGRIDKWAFVDKVSQTIIANLDFSEIKIKHIVLRKVDKIVVDCLHRGKGISKIIYKTTLNYYGCIVSDYFMFGRLTPRVYGVVSLWHKYLTKLGDSKVFDTIDKTFKKYSKKYAFDTFKGSDRLIIVFKNKLLFEKIFGEKQ